MIQQVSGSALPFTPQSFVGRDLHQTLSHLQDHADRKSSILFEHFKSMQQRQASGGGNWVNKEKEPEDSELSPQDFLAKLLAERGYETDLIPAASQPFFHPPASKQVKDYDLPLVAAVKRGDLSCVQQFCRDGRRMDACNKHGESIVHIAARRGNIQILKFLLENGARVDICDDLGRTPLHDACWSMDPQFDCVATILERDLRLLRVVDCRGSSPLAYIKRKHWGLWREFFDSKKEIYWAPRN